MPNLKDIERFKQDIRALGRETELLEGWGETYEDVPPPAQGLSPDLSELVGSPAEESPTEGEEGDLASFLDNLSLGAEPGAEEPESPLAGGLEAPESFFVPDEESSVEALGKPVPDFEGLSGIPGEEGLADQFREEPPVPGPEDEGSIPEGLLGGLTDELEAAAPEPVEADFGGAGESLSEAPGIADEGPAFEMPDFDSGMEEGAEAGPGLADDLSAFEIPLTEPEPPPTDLLPDFGEMSPESGDTFDSFLLDEPAQPASPPSSGAGNLDLDKELASLENDLTPSDNFKLESAWGETDFAIPGYETPAPLPEKQGPGPARPERAARPSPEPFRETEEESAPKVSLSEAQVDALQDTLLSYPLNLRLAIEEALAEEKGTEAQRSRLVYLLVQDASAGEAADLASRILRRPVSVPKAFEKRTGAELEAEKGSLRYILVHTVAPIAAMVLAVVLGLAALGFLGYSFVYRPIRAELLYREGYEEIRQDRFPEAEIAFLKADKVWVHKRWYYRYAEAFAAKNQFVSAARRYDALLERWPNDRRGVLGYAAMEFRSRLDYPKASRLLKGFIEARNYYDADALMLLGDVYLEWAENEGGRGERLFEDARLQYSTLVERYGPKDPYMERMLRWFLRTERMLGRDNSGEILRLKDRFMGDPKSRISSETLADLGGYLLDRGEVEDVSRILFRAVDQDASVPEAHYELSRYFRRIGNAMEERTALNKAIRLLEAVQNPTNRRLGMLIEALNRAGEGYAELGEFVTAEELFNRAVLRYERALSLGQLRRSPVYGKAYANLADVLLFQRDDLNGAAVLYGKSHDHGYVTPETLYKQGYIYYRQERWEGALENFYRAGLDSEESLYLLYATGNALFRREDFFAAQGYYSRLVDRLEFELDQLPLVEPQVRPSHGEIVDLLMRATNNLGVSLFRIGNRMGDARRRAGAMAQFMESSRYYDSLERDPATMIRPETRNLGYLNLDFILRPQRGIDLSIYPDLSKRMRFPKN